MTVAAKPVFRRFGSIRILKDGRVRFSSRCFPDLPHFGFLHRDDLIDVEWAGRKALFVWLDRQRIGTVCCSFDLPPDALRGLVSDMRRAGSGLERWIVPALEFTQAHATGDRNPAMFSAIPELLASCRDLPIAEPWKKIRVDVLANLAQARAERTTAGPTHSAEKIPSPSKAEKTKQRRARTPRK
jgi:hypothetical protein